MFNSNRRKATLGISTALSLLISSHSFAADEAREVFIEQGPNKGELASITENRSAPALVTKGDRKKPAKPSDGSARTGKVNEDFWIYDAKTTVAFDRDGDGYYTRIELDFDADTVFESADVYAVLYLSYEGGPWNEYASTAIFTIFGAGPEDDYFVDTDLVSGYARGSYDLLIDLYDTFDDSLVASFGPEESLELFDLPLEDQLKDEVIVVGPQVTISRGGGGGSSSPWIALLLAGGLAIRRQRR